MAELKKIQIDQPVFSMWLEELDKVGERAEQARESAGDVLAANTNRHDASVTQIEAMAEALVNAKFVDETLTAIVRRMRQVWEAQTDA